MNSLPRDNEQVFFCRVCLTDKLSFQALKKKRSLIETKIERSLFSRTNVEEFENLLARLKRPGGRYLINYFSFLFLWLVFQRKFPLSIAREQKKKEKKKRNARGKYFTELFPSETLLERFSFVELRDRSDGQEMTSRDVEINTRERRTDDLSDRLLTNSGLITMKRGSMRINTDAKRLH